MVFPAWERVFGGNTQQVVRRPTSASANDIALFTKRIRQLFARLSRFLRINPGLRDGGVPEAMAVARGQLLRIKTQLADALDAPVDFFQKGGQFTPGQAIGYYDRVGLLDAAADEKVKQSQEVSLRG